MKTINLFTKGNYTICRIENNKKIKYVTFSDIKDKVYDLCSKYSDIAITEKNIIISNSKIKVNIENYKDNTNIAMIPIIKKLQKDYRELKIKKLRKQKIKRIGAFSCAILISGGIIVNALSNENIINNEDIKSNIISTYNEIKEQQKMNFVVGEEKNDNTQVAEKSLNNFEISFESRVDSEKFQITKAYYNQIITKISNEYGIDPRIMLAIATQESGIHNPDLRGPAMGLMQIELSVWDGESISAYNYAKSAKETINITEEKLKDLEINIRTACMILKDCLDKSYYNLPIAIQMYNFGYGNIQKIFKSSYGDEKSFKEICIDCDNDWLENRENIKEGDNKYLEHILSYVEDLDDIQIKNGEEIVNYSFINKVKTL